MISLKGLTLLTGRHAEAGYILRTFAHYVRDGLIPNLFPEGEKRGALPHGRRHLWFFHALDRYLAATGDRETLPLLLPTLRRRSSTITCAARGSASASIPTDGLLRQGAPGYQLTWMDAKVDDWVVTPRRGKAVEINALWYNALRLLEGWLREEQGDDAAGRCRPARTRSATSFNARFWYARRRLPLRRGRRRGRRRSRLPAQPALRHLAATPGARPRRGGRRCWRSSGSGCSRRSGCARSRRAIPTTRRRTTATCARATRPTTRARSGPG